MVKLIVGNKGFGKTKILIDMVHKAAAASNGNVVCVEKGDVLTFDLKHDVRLVNAEAYHLEGFDALYGFLAGLMAGNYDITDIFVDATLRIGGRDLAQFEAMVQRLVTLLNTNDVNVVFTVSCDASQLTPSLAALKI